MDDMVDVKLVGGPMDGGVLPVDREAVFDDPEPGMDFVPEDSSGAPDDDQGLPLSRVLYTAAPGGPADVWHWRSWVP
ncbi:hypothetical protein [Nocardiopsis sp. NPDC058789]|uniref:hypothetical protein n=1 Tax=Nocardiopsis sp. NPDC058789 TaxID=3346634 RepID=UPI00366AE161